MSIDETPNGAKLSSRSSTISILLVEDSEDDYIFTRRLINKLQAEQTFKLDWETNFDDAVTACETNKYDILLIDYKLDNRDGLELTQTLNPRNIDTPPIIILTGGSSIDLELKAINLGASDCLFKHQLTPLLLARAIYYAIERKKTDNELAKYREHLEELIKERTQELTIARDAAESANTAKSEFLSRMSHNLRTPLNAILGFGQLLKVNPDEELTELQTDNVQEIIHAGNHLLTLVNEILDLSQIESGRININTNSIILAPTIEACVAQLDPLAGQRGINFELDLNESYIVQADETRLKQILMNLISNAIKYSAENGLVKIFCEEVKQHIKVSVQDTGRGISTELLPHLFQPFEQASSPYEAKEGTGIGLSLAKKLVESMHGKIGVESIPEQGSTFWFELPLKA